MNNKEQVIVVCGFKAWGDKLQYPPFGVKYLLEVNIEDTEEEGKCIKIFKEEFKAKIGKEFDGDILFVENADLVIL